MEHGPAKLILTIVYHNFLPARQTRLRDRTNDDSRQRKCDECAREVCSTCLYGSVCVWNISKPNGDDALSGECICAETRSQRWRKIRKAGEDTSSWTIRAST